MGFLTEQEIKDLKVADKYAGVGQIRDPWKRIEERKWESMRKLFADYPTKMTKEQDILRYLPYDRNDFFTELQAERLKSEGLKPVRSLPWVYQKGLIFKATLMRESPKAFMFRVKPVGVFWSPKAQVDWEPLKEGGFIGHVWLPEWLIKDKGLEEKDADPDLNFKEEEAGR